MKLLAFLNILVSFVKSSSTSLSSHTLSSEEMYFMPSVLLNATHEKWPAGGMTHTSKSPQPLFSSPTNVALYQLGFSQP